MFDLIGKNSNTCRIYQVSNSFDKVYKENY